jgi:hypothetical protein
VECGADAAAFSRTCGMDPSSSDQHANWYELWLTFPRRVLESGAWCGMGMAVRTGLVVPGASNAAAVITHRRDRLASGDRIGSAFIAAWTSMGLPRSLCSSVRARLHPLAAAGSTRSRSGISPHPSGWDSSAGGVFVCLRVGRTPADSAGIDYSACSGLAA